MKERCLVNGLGFIGSNLVKSLERSGSEVIKGNRLGIVPPDIDRIYDLSAYGNMHGQNEVDEIYRANVARVVDLLRTTENYKSCILTSSSAVLLSKQTFYSSSKKAMEDLAQRWVEETDKPVVVVRPATIIGPGEQPQHLIPTLIRSCQTGERMKFVPHPTHDFLHVQDFVDGVMLIAKYANELKGQVLDLGTGIPSSNRMVLDLVEEYTGKKANIEEVALLRKHDTQDWTVPPSLQLMKLGWKRKYTLEQTIEQMI